MNEFKGKKVLILSGQDVHRKLVETAQMMGIYTIVTDYLEDSPCKKIADESLMISTLDLDNIIRVSKDRNIDAIINFCNDPAARIVQKVNEKLGLPNIGTWDQVCTFTDKELFKKACIRNDVDVVKAYSKEDVNNNAITYPVIVKPTDSRGSRGSNVCRNIDEVKDAIIVAKNNSLSSNYLIEQYMNEYQEVEITYLVIEDEPYLIGFADRYTGSEKDGTGKITSCLIEPSWFIETYLKNVDPKVKRMLKKEGIKNTAVIMQGFIDGDTVRMFDPGMRFQGNEFERILLRACGVNAMESVISYALSGKMESFNGGYNEAYRLNGQCAVQYMINGRAGVISKYEGIDILLQDPRLVYLGHKCKIGDSIEITGDTNQRIFDISFLTKRSNEEVIKIIDFVNNNLKVMDEYGNDMITSRFDYRKISPHI